MVYASSSFYAYITYMCMCVFFNLNEIVLHVLFWFLSLLLNLMVSILFAKSHQVLYMKYFK